MKDPEDAGDAVRLVRVEDPGGRVAALERRPETAIVVAQTTFIDDMKRCSVGCSQRDEITATEDEMVVARDAESPERTIHHHGDGAFRRSIGVNVSSELARMRRPHRLQFNVVWSSIVSSRSDQGRKGRTPAELADAAPGAYWDGILEEVQGSPAVDAWRVYMRRVYGRLLAAWSPAPTTPGFSLKTDLFEEAVSSHSVLGDLGRGSVGIDCSPEIVRAAYHRLGPEYRMVVGDLRHVPLRSGCIGRILAGSSLDHFADRHDIAVALAELARVLAPGGTLVITFDNPLNPVVWLRNRLPFAWLHRLKLVPYFVGATYDHVEATRELERLGLRVLATGTVAHAPRLPAVWLAAVSGWLGRPALSRVIARLLERFEALGRLPTRYRTGYYVALRAMKADG